jgi:hypothetical protein
MSSKPTTQKQGRGDDSSRPLVQSPVLKRKTKNKTLISQLPFKIPSQTQVSEALGHSLGISPIRRASHFVTYVHNETPIFGAVVLTGGFF